MRTRLAAFLAILRAGARAKPTRAGKAFLAILDLVKGRAGSPGDGPMRRPIVKKRAQVEALSPGKNSKEGGAHNLNNVPLQPEFFSAGQSRQLAEPTESAQRRLVSHTPLP